MKLVLDTNVLISALFWQGTPHEILISIKKGTFALYITPVLLDELKDVLSRPKFLDLIE
ncbi:MAG: putative toxin-antitoxin system toxin component, PIN family [Candidatus Anammoxibacter sp.]